MHQYVRCEHASGALADAESGGGLPYVGGYAVSETSELFGRWRYDYTKPAYDDQVPTLCRCCFCARLNMRVIVSTCVADLSQRAL